jgi:hypothetical protein
VTAGSSSAQRSDDFRNMEPMKYWKYVPSGWNAHMKFSLISFGAVGGFLGLPIWFFRSSVVRHLGLSAMVYKAVVNLGPIR